MSTVHGFFRRLLGHTAQAIYRWPGVIAGLGVVFTLFCGWYAYHNFKVVNSIGDLLDDKSGANRIYREYTKEFNVDEEYIIVINSNDPLLNRRIADTVATRLHDLGPGVGRIFYKLDFSGLERRFLLLEKESSLLQIEKDVNSYAQALKTTKVNFDLHSMLNQASSAMGNEQYLRKKENWKDFKPFVDRFASMLTQLADSVEGKTGPVSGNDLSTTDISEMIAEKEYLSYDHGRTLLVMASPGEREHDAASPYSGTLVKIRGILADLHAQNPTVSIGLTGEPVLNDDEMQTAAKDVTYASIITFVLIVLLFAVSYKEYARPGWAILVLIMAVVWCFAATMFVVGHLNILTNAFVPMVLGLGIDFGIQIMGRYEEELGRGLSIQDALTATLEHTGVAVITGGSTTAAAFYSMCLSDFKGLAELGAICGTSMVLCILAYLVLLPAIYVLRDRKRPAAELQSAEIAAESHFTAAFNTRIVRHPYIVLAIGGVVTVVCLFSLRTIRFDYNLLNMQNQKLESVRVEKALLKELGSSSIYASITVDNIDQARAVTEQLESLPTVKEVQSIANLLPDRQEQKLAIIRRIVGSLQGVKLDTDVAVKIDIAKARHDVSALLASSREAREQAAMYAGTSRMAREAVETFKLLIPPLERAEKAMSTLSDDELALRLNRYQADVFGRMQRGLAWLKNAETRQPITLEDVPLPLRQRFIGNHGKLLLQIYAKNDIWDREPLVAFVNDVQSVDKNVTGTPIQNYAYIDLLRVSYQKAASWAFVAIVVLILLHFRSIISAALAILPLALGVIWTLGIMGLFHIKFNPANIMTLPMLLGIGVAYGVYTTDRFREVGRMEIFSTSTGKAIVLSALTTLFGFASMLISDYRGLFSLGLVMTIGVLACLVTSLGLLPQILKLLEKKQ